MRDSSLKSMTFLGYSNSKRSTLASYRISRFPRERASNDLDLWHVRLFLFFSLSSSLKSDYDTRASLSDSHSYVLSVGRSPSLPPPLCFRNCVAMSHCTSHISAADSVVRDILSFSYMYVSHACHTSLCPHITHGITHSVNVSGHVDRPVLSPNLQEMWPRIGQDLIPKSRRL